MITNHFDAAVNWLGALIQRVQEHPLYPTLPAEAAGQVVEAQEKYQPWTLFEPIPGDERDLEDRISVLSAILESLDPAEGGADGCFTLRGAPAYQAHLGKLPSLTARLSLNFHLIHIADGGAPGPSSLEAAQLAIRWTDFFRSTPARSTPRSSARASNPPTSWPRRSRPVRSATARAFGTSTAATGPASNRRRRCAAPSTSWKRTAGCG